MSWQDAPLVAPASGGPAWMSAPLAGGKGDRLPMAPGAVLHAMPADTVQGGPTDPGLSPDEGALRASTNAIGQDLSFGLMDEAVAGAAAAVDPLANLFRSTPVGGSFDERYARHLANQRLLEASSRAQHPVASVVGDVGSIAAMGPRAGLTAGVRTAAVPAVLTRAVPLATKVRQGATIGGIYGAASGFGAGEGGFENRVTGAAKGGALGAATGAALPVAGAVVGAVGRPIINAVGARIRPAAYAVQKVAERIAAGGRTIPQTAARIQRAAAAGDRMTLADAGGEQLQRLGRTIINAGGPGGTALKTKIGVESLRQGGRIEARVENALGVPGLPYQEAKNLIMDARSGIGPGAATPHYDQFYQTPVPYTHRLEEVLNTPAGRAGLAEARTNSLNRREPWAQWFLNVNPNGTIINARRVPDARALDEIRRVIRGQQEAAMAPPTGQPFARPRRTPRSDAIGSVYNDLTDEMMAAGETRPGARDGPFYHANQAGLDNIQADEAIDFGRDYMKTDPRIIQRRMGGGGAGRDRVFTPGQQELARVGVVDAARTMIDNRSLTANKLVEFFNKPVAVNRLRHFFRTPQEFQAFRQQMLTEALKRKKIETMRGNSTTTQQLMDAQEATQLENSTQVVTDLARGRPVAAVLGWLTRAANRMGGLTPQVGDQIQRIITTADPARVTALIRQLAAIERSRIGASQRRNAFRNALTAAGASQAGQARATKPSRP